MMLDPVFGMLLLGAFALLFASASLHKWRNLARFDEVFAAYGLVPHALRPVARAIPLLESAVALALWPAATRTAACLTGMLLLLSYAGAMALNLQRGRRDIACGCGGPDERRPIAPHMVWRNLLLAVALGVPLLPWSARALQVTDWVSIAFGIAVAAVVYVCVDRLGQVLRQAQMLRGPA